MASGNGLIWGDGTGVNIPIPIPTAPFELDFIESSYINGVTYARGIGGFEWQGDTYIAACCYTSGLYIYKQNPSDGTLTFVSLAPGGTGVGRFHGAPIAIGDRLFAPARDEGLLVFDLNTLGNDTFYYEKVIPVPDSSLTTGVTPKTTGLHYNADLDILFIFQRTGGWNAITNVSTTPTQDLAVSSTLHLYTSNSMTLELHRGDTYTINGNTYLPAPGLTGSMLINTDVTNGVNAPVQSHLCKTVLSPGCWDARHVGNGKIVTTQWGYPAIFLQNFGVGLFDLSDPRRMRLRNRLIDPELPYYGAGKDSPPYDLVLTKGLAVIAAGKMGVWAVNYSNPYNLTKEYVAPVPDAPTSDYGYTSVCVANGYAYAIACDIPAQSALRDTVRIDSFAVSGVPVVYPASYRGFVQKGEPEYYIAEYFTENYTDGEVLSGTLNFPDVMWNTSSKAPVLTWANGASKISASVSPAYQALRLYDKANIPTKFSFAGTVQITGTPPSNGQFINIDLASTRDTSSSGHLEQVAQLRLQPSSLGGVNVVLRVKHTGVTVYSTVTVSNVTANVDDAIAVCGQIDLDAGTLAIKVNGGAWKTTSISDAVAAPTLLGIGVVRTNTTDIWDYELLYTSRFVFAEGLVEISPERQNIWELSLESAPQSKLAWEHSAASKKGSLDDLSASGDWFFDAGSSKLYLYSVIDPNTAPWGLYAGNPV